MSKETSGVAMKKRIREREKYVNWISVSIPKTYYEQIEVILKAKQNQTSVSEWLRSKIETWLKEEHGI